MERERLIRNLADAGCTGEAAQKIIQLCNNGDLSEALRLMKIDRCRRNNHTEVSEDDQSRRIKNGYRLG